MISSKLQVTSLCCFSSRQMWYTETCNRFQRYSRKHALLQKAVVALRLGSPLYPAIVIFETTTRNILPDDIVCYMHE